MAFNSLFDIIGALGACGIVVHSLLFDAGNLPTWYEHLRHTSQMCLPVPLLHWASTYNSLRCYEQLRSY